MKIQVNKQVELMWGLLQCSDYVNVVPMQCEDTGNEFRKKNIEFLSQFKNEKIFTLLNELVSDKTAYFIWDAPNDVALAMDKNYNFFGHDFQAFVGKLHSNPKVLEFLAEFKTFAEKIEYDSFFAQYKNYFNEIIQNHKKIVDKEVDKVFEFMKKFYLFEPNQDKYVMNLLFSVSWSGIGSQIGETVHISDSLKFNKNKGWHFLFHDNNEEYIAHILHEFSHPVINPLSDKHKVNASFIADWDYINKKQGVGYQGFSRSYVNESLIRAIQVYFLEKVYNYPTEERILREENNGYLHIRHLVQELYSLEDKHFDTFEDKYLELLNIFKTELDKDNFIE